VVVEGVDKVEVDAVGAEATQAGFGRAHDVTAGQTRIVGSIASRVEDLRGEDYLVAAVGD
jgi:hypothetical protein